MKKGFILEENFEAYCHDAVRAGAIRSYVRHPHWSEKDQRGVDFEVTRLSGSVVRLDVFVQSAQRLRDKIREAQWKEMDAVVSDQMMRKFAPQEIDTLLEGALKYWGLVKEGYQF